MSVFGRVLGDSSSFELALPGGALEILKLMWREQVVRIADNFDYILVLPILDDPDRVYHIKNKNLIQVICKVLRPNTLWEVRQVF